MRNHSKAPILMVIPSRLVWCFIYNLKRNRETHLPGWADSGKMKKPAGSVVSAEESIIWFFENISGGFYFFEDLEVIIITITIPTAMGFVYLDGAINMSQEGFKRFFFVSSADSGRSILTTISGAMIGVAGTVFSVTLVALTLASSQFGPRLLKTLCMWPWIR